MIDPPRLRDADGGVGQMLSAARADGPRDAAADRRRVLAALAALEGPGVATAGTGRDLQGSRSSRWTRGAIAGAGLAVIGAIVAVSISSSAPSDDVAPASPAAPAPTSEEPARATQATHESSATVPIPSVDVVDLPTAAAHPSTGGVRRAELAPKPKDALATATTADELAAVERVRLRLAGGDVKGARREVASYRATFVRGRFIEEIDALEIEALAGDGAGVEARTKAADFAQRYPSSPYARRVRSVVSALDETGAP